MLARLSMTLDNAEISYRQSSNLQGVLMEQITTEYAEQLHGNHVNPYSQYIEKRDGKTIWNITTLNTTAYEKILLPLLSASFATFTIKKKDMQVSVLSKNVATMAKSELITQFYEGEGEKYINVEFVTPTAFKSNGNYIFYPDLRLIYTSLMNRYSSVSEDVDMRDEDTLNQLEQNSQIIRYHLKSCTFPLEGVNIPGFTGTITIRLHGNKTMTNYIKLLFTFAEYAGIGIKTSMGMGHIRLFTYASGTNTRKGGER